MRPQPRTSHTVGTLRSPRRTAARACLCAALSLAPVPCRDCAGDGRDVWLSMPRGLRATARSVEFSRVGAAVHQSGIDDVLASYLGQL